MKVRCPSCGNEADLPEEEHYRQVACPNCGSRFQAVTEATQQVSRDFINEYLKSLKKPPEE